VSGAFVRDVRLLDQGGPRDDQPDNNHLSELPEKWPGDFERRDDLAAAIAYSSTRAGADGRLLSSTGLSIPACVHIMSATD
jgi:hypothetical protein